jgi:hypothetical protein
MADNRVVAVAMLWLVFDSFPPLSPAPPVVVAPVGDSSLLLENGDDLLLESGDRLLLE